jgi:DNA-binding CsgD family transcriptional regulator
MNSTPAQAFASEFPTLAPGEIEIVRHLATGASTRDLTSTLDTSDHAIKAALTQLRTKLEARSTVHAVARAIALGIIPADTALYEYEWPLPDDLPQPDPLTPRETQLLRLSSYGSVTNAALARVLDIDEKTVKRHMSNILSKLGARNRREAIAIARHAGIL